MSKRQFRSRDRARDRARDDLAAPDYPTTESFESGRRAFLVKLGGVLLGAGALAACGDRPVKTTSQPDIGGPAGVAPQPDGWLPLNDGGSAPMPDAGIDAYRGPRGVPPAPDANVDKVDVGMAGVPRLPDATIDKHDASASPGYAPAMDAAIDDGGSGPNP